MSASPTSAAAAPSTKRPLEDPSSPSAPTDQPDAKRPALDKILKEDEEPSAGDTEQTTTETQQISVKATELQAETAPVANGTANTNGETVTSEAVNRPTTATVQETQPIQSTASHSDRATSHPPSNMPSQDETNWIHIRAVISSAEAATCIGKGGENVSQIRRMSNAKCTVSDYARGAVERILTVSGQQDAVAKVCTT
jgi:heterogeneous nuclear rnp K-like protein